MGGNIVATIMMMAVLMMATLPNRIDGKEVVVFVHGFLGFGPDEMGPVNYWSEMDEFRKLGFEVYEASMGPVSSNWDRACELFAQIKGTRVDYGAAHSKKYGHERFGKDYTGKGFFPQWDSNNRIHFVAHSMGGMTVSMLELLLQEGDSEEKKAGATSQLFTKQGNWIKTITTVSTPHDGTTLVDVLGGNLVDIIETFVAGFAGVTSGSLVDAVYDLDLDHWGLGRRDGESFWKHLQRIKDSPVLSFGNKDLSPYDLSVQGALDLQEKRPQTYPNTYYFSYATEQTFSHYACNPLKLKCGMVDNPEPTMWIILAPFANRMGGFDYDESWRKNDGVVPFNSARCPKLRYGGDSNCFEMNSRTTFQPSKYYWERVGMDHLQVIGFTLIYSRDDDPLYRKMADRVLQVSVSNYRSVLVSSDDLSENLNDGSGAISPTGAIIMLSIGAVGMLIGVGALVSVKRQLNQQNRNKNVVPSPRHGKVVTPHRGHFTFDQMEAQNPRFANIRL